MARKRYVGVGDVARALETLDSMHRPLTASVPSGLPEHIVQILPQAQAHAQGQVDRLNERLVAVKSQLEALLNAARRPGLSRRAALAKLRQAAGIFSATAAPVTACVNQACSHCCHIPVALLEAEAQLIGEAIGRKPRKVARGKALSREYGYHRPCPFLRSGRCSIYAHRPFACRTHLNLDVSDRLCALRTDALVPVPLVDVTQFQMQYVALAGDEAMADIRDFFPDGLGHR